MPPRQRAGPGSSKSYPTAALGHLRVFCFARCLLSSPRAFRIRHSLSSDSDAVLLEGEIERPVPALVYPPGHLLLVRAVPARRLRGLGVPRLLGQPLQELVGGYLQVLRGVAVSRVLARLVAPGLVAHALQERRSHRLSLLARRSAAPQGVQPLTHAPLVLLGLAPVLLEHTLDLRVVGGGDHGVDHLKVVLLHGVCVLDVVRELLIELVVGHACLLWADRRLGTDPVVFISNRSKNA